MSNAVIEAPEAEEPKQPRKRPTKVATIPGLEETPAKTKGPSRDELYARRTNQFFLDPRKIDRRPGWNPRFEFGEIEELMKSIRFQKAQDGHGLLNDLRVKRKDNTDRFELVDGDRRLTAIERLMDEGVEWQFGVPVKVVAANSSEIQLLIQMFEANSGKPFLPMEEAVAYKRMREAGMTIQEICAAVQRKQVHVVNTLALVDASDEVKQAVVDNRVGSTLAKDIAVVARGDTQVQRELISEAVAAGKDKTALRKVKTKIEQVRREKASRSGRVLKVKPLTDEQLNELGAKVGERIAEKLQNAGFGTQAALLKKCSKDDQLAAAFTLGALEALKAAAGIKVNLFI